MVQRFDLAAITPTPWKNGGGATRELACWPPGAGMDRFAWRVSVATIDQPGPFSAFAGVDRQIMLLQGDGVHLQARDGAVDHVLDQPWQPFAFAGDTALDCTLLGGTSTDFNLMLRRGAWRGGVQVVREPVLPGVSAAGLCMVLSGAWEWGGDVFTVGQGLWWSEALASTVDMTPLDGEHAGSSGAPALAWIAMSPSI